MTAAARNFADIASQSDHCLMVGAGVALIQDQNPRIRAFAKTMLRDHARTAADLRQAARRPASCRPRRICQATLVSALQGA